MLPRFSCPPKPQRDSGERISDMAILLDLRYVVSRDEISCKRIMREEAGCRGSISYERSGSMKRESFPMENGDPYESCFLGKAKDDSFRLL